MRYLLLINGVTTDGAPRSQAERDAEMAAYQAFNRELQERGIILSAARLHPPHTATTVRVRGGKLLTSDGPFAETKEQLGGFNLVECKDLDEAIEVASKCPAALRGSVEIRPISDIA